MNKHESSRGEIMKKTIIKSDSITFDEFIDLITEHRGEQIKERFDFRLGGGHL